MVHLLFSVTDATPKYVSAFTSSIQTPGLISKGSLEMLANLSGFFVSDKKCFITLSTSVNILTLFL
jgi:hypothetical protein